MDRTRRSFDLTQPSVSHTRVSVRLRRWFEGVAVRADPSTAISSSSGRAGCWRFEWFQRLDNIAQTSTSFRTSGLSSSATAAVDAASRHLRQITEGSSDLLILLGPDLRILFANRLLQPQQSAAIEQTAGHVGLSIGDCLPQRSRARALVCLRGVLQLGVPDRFEIELTQVPDACRYQEIRVAPVMEAGRTVALVLNGSDTTQHVLAQRAVATQARMIESMLEGVALIDAADDIVITNPAFDALFGFERGMLIGWPLTQLATTAGFEPDRLQIARQGAGSWPLEFEARRPNGERVILAGVLSQLRDAQGDHRLLVLQDVTERKQLERAMLEAVSREQYRIGNDLHDGLGQELTGIALMLRCLAGRLAVEHRQVLPDVESITRLVNNAVESTRSLARGLSPVNLERGGLRDALAGLAMHARSIYGIKVLFTNRIDPQIKLNAELANHLYRIAQEAVTNAVKHGRAHVVRLHLSSARRRVRLAIADDGRGMPNDALTTSGLGLRIMRYRARIAGGDLRFEAVEPSGTRVVCDCPIEQPSAQSNPAGRRAHRRPKRPAAGTTDGVRHNHGHVRVARSLRKS